jgi:hypothetical protein
MSSVMDGKKQTSQLDDNVPSWKLQLQESHDTLSMQFKNMQHC